MWIDYSRLRTTDRQRLAKIDRCQRQVRGQSGSLPRAGNVIPLLHGYLNFDCGHL